MKKLSRLEDALTEAASADDTAKLDQLVQSSEADVLQFRGLDRKRMSQEQAMGLSGIPFGEIPEHLNENARKQLLPSFDALKTQLTNFSEAQERAERIMRVRLFDINLRISDMPLPSKHDTRA